MHSPTRLILALSATILLTTAAPALADTTAATPATGAAQTLSVLGQGRTFVSPDVASLNITVARSASTSRAALGAANRATDGIVGALRHLGIAAADIQTGEVSVSSEVIPARRHHPRRVTWTATETLQVTVRNISSTGAAIDAATRAGASTIDGPSYSFSDPSAGKLAATRAAIADARRRADDAAAALGYHVTGVQSIDLDPGSEVVIAGTGASNGSSTPAPKAPTPTNVHPGTQEVDAQVAIVYTIAPA